MMTVTAGRVVIGDYDVRAQQPDLQHHATQHFFLAPGAKRFFSGLRETKITKAQKVRALVKRDYVSAFEKCDAILTPTSPSVAFKIGERSDDPLAMYLNDVCTIPSNLSGDPAVSVPFGTGDDGLPVGVQVMANALQEATVFRVGAALEASA